MSLLFNSNSYVGWDSGRVIQHVLRYRRPSFQPQQFKVNKQITQNLHILNAFLLSCYWTQEHMSPRREHVSFKEKWKQLFCSKQCSLTKHLLYFPGWSASRFTANPTLPQSSCVRDKAILMTFTHITVPLSRNSERGLGMGGGGDSQPCTGYSTLC